MDPFDLEILFQQRSVMMNVKCFCLNMLFNGKADVIENTKLLNNGLPILTYSFLLCHKTLSTTGNLPVHV